MFFFVFGVSVDVSRRTDAVREIQFISGFIFSRRRRWRRRRRRRRNDVVIQLNSDSGLRVGPSRHFPHFLRWKNRSRGTTTTTTATTTTTTTTATAATKAQKIKQSEGIKLETKKRQGRNYFICGGISSSMSRWEKKKRNKSFYEKKVVLFGFQSAGMFGMRLKFGPLIK